MSVFYIYLLRENFSQVPRQLYQAAKVDGTSDIKFLVRILLLQFLKDLAGPVPGAIIHHHQFLLQPRLHGLHGGDQLRRGGLFVIHRNNHR